MLVCAGRRDVYFDVWMFLLKEGKRCRKHINATHAEKGDIKNANIPFRNNFCPSVFSRFIKNLLKVG